MVGIDESYAIVLFEDEVPSFEVLVEDGNLDFVVSVLDGGLIMERAMDIYDDSFVVVGFVGERCR